MDRTIELVHGLTQEELVAKIHFYLQRGQNAERALGFYLLDMQERGAFKPEKDAVVWALKNLDYKGAGPLILLARRLEELPEIDAAFDAGEVQWTKVREIARVATSDTDLEWLAFARSNTCRVVEKAVSKARRGDRPGESRKGLKAAWRQKYVERVYLTGEQKAMWGQANRKVRRELGNGATPSDALAEMSLRTIAPKPEGDSPKKKANPVDACLIVFHLGQDNSTWADTPEGRVEVDPSVLLALVRAGARTIKVRGIEGAGECKAIRFGERGKVAPEDRDDPVSPELREAVLARDGCCVICGSLEDLTPHHLDSHANGGKSMMERLVTVCRTCHGLLHDWEIILRVEVDGSLTILDRDRRVIGKSRTAAEVAWTEEACGSRLAACASEARAASRQSPAGFQEWMALESRIEWSQSARAFIFHPDWPETPPAAVQEKLPEAGLPAEGFEAFVGQRAVLDDLLPAGQAARERNEPLRLKRLAARGLRLAPQKRGPPAASRQSPAGFAVLAGNISDPYQLVSLLARLRKNETFFIDEVHRLDEVCEEALYGALQERVVEVTLREAGAGVRSRTVKIRLEPFTLIAATTRVGALSEPFRGRFRHVERLEPYGEEELAQVVTGAAGKLGAASTPEAAREVARRSRGTPREAVRILERARDTAQLSGARAIDRNHVVAAAKRLGIDEYGLDRVERAAVKLLVERRRPIGRESLAARLGVDLETYRDVHEPWLERSGLLERTEAGRVATAKAFAFYGPRAEGGAGSDVSGSA